MTHNVAETINQTSNHNNIDKPTQILHQTLLRHTTTATLHNTAHNKNNILLEQGSATTLEIKPPQLSNNLD
jgi:hypothetical protein